VITACKYFGHSYALHFLDVSPVNCKFIGCQPELSFGVEAAAEDISLVSQAQGVVESCSYHFYVFAQQRLHQNWLILVLGHS